MQAAIRNWITCLIPFIRHGYQAEIKNGWKVRSLGNMPSTQSGKRFSACFLFLPLSDFSWIPSCGCDRPPPFATGWGQGSGRQDPSQGPVLPMNSSLTNIELFCDRGVRPPYPFGMQNIKTNYLLTCFAQPSGIFWLFTMYQSMVQRQQLSQWPKWVDQSAWLYG